ncbi:hypothetical protein Fmac_007382 [Flemingia macrophylla]|uniref:Uncharacterized protein n=1 Tax=Flemingia macrophylla TaxID=520843 RepID=A0ABD1MUF4_9FABA
MFDNKGEGIPWLILTQLIVLLLLLALIFVFAVFPFDSDDNHSTPSNVFLVHEIQPIHSPPPLANRDSHPTTRQHRLQGGQNLLIKGEAETGPSMRSEEIMEVEVEEEEDSSVYVHPCNYFQLATVAFLKCFGMDSTSDGPSTRKHRKRKEN